MAVETGTATNFGDLYNKLITFLTTNVGVGMNWTMVHGYEQGDDVTITGSTQFTTEDDKANKCILEGVGTGVGGEVYVGLYTTRNVFDEAYTISLVPMAGYDSNFNVLSQPTVGLASNPKILCWDAAMPYWFVASDRRFMAVVKVNTTYQFLYAGFFLPYSLPDEYPYPYLVGAMSDDNVAASKSDSYNDCFLQSARREHGQICFPDGNWRYVSGGLHNDVSATLAPFNVAGYGDSADDNYWHYYRPDKGGVYHLIKLEPCCGNPATGLGVFGCLDGVHFVSGFENSPENTVDIDGISHFVFTNSFRVANNNYFTMRLL
ncbi:hypothetical protein ACOKWN_003820 [Vibrio parahaemolyticus]